MLFLTTRGERRVLERVLAAPTPASNALKCSQMLFLATRGERGELERVLAAPDSTFS